MPLNVDRISTGSLSINGTEITGKEGLLTNIWIPLQFDGLESGGYLNLYGTKENLFYGNGNVYQLPNLNSNTPYSFYEDNNGLIHIGVPNIVSA